MTLQPICFRCHNTKPTVIPSSLLCSADCHSIDGNSYEAAFVASIVKEKRKSGSDPAHAKLYGLVSDVCGLGLYVARRVINSLAVDGFSARAPGCMLDSLSAR